MFFCGRLKIRIGCAMLSLNTKEGIVCAVGIRIMTKARKDQLHKVVENKESIQSLHQYIEQEYMDADGYAVIDICLYDGLEWVDPMSMGRQRDLNPEIYAFIERKANIIPAQIPLKLRFHGDGVSVPEQDEIRRLLAEHYTVVLHDKIWDKRNNRRKLVGLFAVGLAFLSLYFFFALQREDGLFLEVLSVIGSFAVWEAADCLILERREINTEILNTAQNLTQDVEFVSGED